MAPPDPELTSSIRRAMADPEFTKAKFKDAVATSMLYQMEGKFTKSYIVKQIEEALSTIDRLYKQEKPDG